MFFTEYQDFVETLCTVASLLTGETWTKVWRAFAGPLELPDDRTSNVNQGLTSSVHRRKNSPSSLLSLAAITLTIVCQTARAIPDFRFSIRIPRDFVLLSLSKFTPSVSRDSLKNTMNTYRDELVAQDELVVDERTRSSGVSCESTWLLLLSNPRRIARARSQLRWFANFTPLLARVMEKQRCS